MPQPSYTRQAIRDNVAGSVVLRVVIDERGEVRVLKVIRSVPELDEEAIRVVEADWRFHPATKNGRPVAALSDLIVRFNLY
jgi:protein TonB